MMDSEKSSPDKSYTVAQLAALRYLSKRPAGSLSKHEIYDYYCGNGFVSGMARVSRRGAAGRMWWKLVDLGLVDDRHGRLTPLGLEAIR
jgi:hypothetical protein